LPTDIDSVRRVFSSVTGHLRGRTDRAQLTIRYLPLDAAEEGRLLQAAELSTDAFSPPRAFGPADSIQVRSVTGDEVPVGFTMHLLPRTREGRFDGFEAGAVVRPERGTLLPVLRGTVAADRSETLLVVGEADGDPVLLALLRLTVAGTEAVARIPPPRRHRVDFRLWRIPSRSLANAIGGLVPPEQQGRPPLVAFRLDRRTAKDLEETFAVAADPLRPTSLLAPAADGKARSFELDEVPLWIYCVLDPDEYRYETRFWLRDATRAPRIVAHGVHDFVLVALFDEPGEDFSLVGIASLRPVPAD
jgi:hypothetical protein